MRTLIVHVIIFGIIMTSHADTSSNALPDFDKQWDYFKPVETRAKFEEILPKAEASGDSEYLNQLLTQIARTYGLNSEFDSAHAILDRVEAQLPKEPSVATVRYLLERGRTYRSAGDPKTAEPLFVKAFEFGQELKADYFTIDAAHMVAIAVGKKEDKRKWNLLGIKLAEAATEKRARDWRASLCNNMGWDYFESGEYDRALELFEQALEAHLEKGVPKQIDIAYWSVAKGQRMVGRIDESLATQLRLLKKYQEEGTEDGYVYEELGELYLVKGEKAVAKEYFAKAYRSLSQDQWMMDNEPERMERMKTLGAIE